MLFSYRKYIRFFMITSFRDCISRIDIAPEHKPLLYKASAATALAAGALYTPWETTKIIGSTVLAGIGYGIANDMIASWGCSNHFDKKHISDSSNLRSHPIQGLHASLNAVISGMFDYWRVSAIAGAVFAVIARAPLSIFKVKIQATQITPYLAIEATLATLVIQISTRILQKHHDTPKKTACSIQHAASYGTLALGNILLATAILTTRVGWFRLIK